jgi:membrane protease YdiL (CAAX protease family)
MTFNETSPSLKDDRKRVGRLVYATLFLITTTVGIVILESAYSSHLSHSGHFSQVRSLSENSDRFAPIFSLVQFLIVLLIFRPISRNIGSRTPENPDRRSMLRSIILGVVVGLAAVLLSLPVLTAFGPSSIAVSLANHLLSASSAVIFVVLIFLLPIATEILFRGILLAQFLDVMPLIPAFLASTLLFVCVWTAFNPIVALILGLAVGILFYRTRNLLACIISDLVFSLATLVLLILRTLYRF